MSSISSSLNTINRSLLTEIQSYSSPTSSTGTTASTSSTSQPDKLDFSQAGQLFQQLQQLQSSNPTEFKQVLTDAVAKLKDAASQQTDPTAAAVLDNVADRFQKAADTGDLSAIHPQSPQGAQGAGGAHGHHHGHHGGGVKNDTDTTGDSTTDPDSTTSSTDPLSALIAQVNTQSQQTLFSYLDAGQSTTGTSSDLLSSVLSAGQSSQPGSATDNIQSLLNSFVTTDA